MAPLGAYVDFDDCVRKNQDKRSPDAYCGAILRAISRRHQDAEGSFTRVVTGLELFSTGRHEDASGQVDDWEGADLDEVVANFDAGLPEFVPVKLGHTSEEFNQRVSQALNVPSDLFEGEDGGGVPAIGRLVRLSKDGEKLVGDLEVAGQLQDLIETGLYRQVSVELVEDPERGWVLSAVALLGAERPAVKDLAGLASAAVLTERRAPVRVFTSPGVILGMTERGGAPVPLATPAVVRADPAAADITRLSEQRRAAEFRAAALEKRVAELGAELAGAREGLRRMQFAERVRAFTAVPRDLDDMVDVLMELDNRIGHAAAERQVAEWGQMQRFAEDAGLFRATGTSGAPLARPAGHPFEMRVARLATSEGISREVALARLAEAHPADFGEYYAWTQRTASPAR
jgi:hypothetical protein